MKVRCPTCLGAIPGQDIDLVGRVAVCRPCGEVFALPLPGTDSALATATAPPAGLALPVDLHWSEITAGDTFRGEITRSRLVAIPMLAFALVWNGITFSILAAMLLSGHPANAIFLTLHAAAGLAMLYLAVCQTVNRTAFQLTGGVFAFGHGPVPERGALRLPMGDVAGFTAVERHGTGRNARGRWTVAVRTRDGRSIPLKLALQGNDQAAYVASRLDHALAYLRPQRGYRELP